MHTHRADARTIFSVKHADVYRGEKKAVSALSWEVKHGEHWCILGANGSGKSTLLALLAGELWPALGGEIMRIENDVPVTEIKLRMGYVSATLHARYDGESTVEQTVLSGFVAGEGIEPEYTHDEHVAAARAIDACGLTEYSHRLFSALSYGQARRVLLARAVVHSPDVLLLDEPFTGLDMSSKRFMMDTINTAAAAGTTVIMVLHYLDELPACITNTLTMKDGHAVF